MSILLVQHGKSFSKEQDPKRGLTDEGIAEVLKIAKVAKAYNITVKNIYHSGKKRSIQTAEIFAAELNAKENISEIAGIGPMDDIEKFAKNISTYNNTMIVGHLPFMQKLVSFLTTGMQDLVVFKFQNGGVVCLDIDESKDKYSIKWALMPDVSN